MVFILNSNPTIFIHGFKGSRLLSATGDVQWITGSVACGLRTPRLSLPMTYVAGIQKHDSLRPDGPVERVTLIPRLVEQNVYGPWLDFLRSTGGPVSVFCYDWRRDNNETVLRFTDFVDNVRKKNGGAPVRVVAHSMGGLVTLSALHQGLEGVADVFFAGVPFAGGVGFLDDMHAGVPTGLNRRVTSQTVLATFPSVYTLFPLADAELYAKDGTLLAPDMFDPATWRKLRLGVYRTKAGPKPGFDAFLEETLRVGRKFRETLSIRLREYPQLHAIVGTGRPTLGAVQATNEAATEWDIAGGRRDDGDGRVRRDHALPPSGIPFTQHTSTYEHAAILNDPAVMRLVSQLPVPS